MLKPPNELFMGQTKYYITKVDTEYYIFTLYVTLIGKIKTV